MLMKRSEHRILVTHQGTLPRPQDLQAMVTAKANGETYDEPATERRTKETVAEMVRRQAAIGIDIPNDGEMSKTTFSDYVSTRLGGLEPTDRPYISPISGRDLKEFPEYFDTSTMRQAQGERGARGGGVRRVIFQCRGPMTYTGQQAVQTDIANLKAALAGTSFEEAYLPAVAPGSIEHWLKNSHYTNEEAFLYAIGDAMHEEYKAIVDAGLILQIDDPDLADGWQVHPDLDLTGYRKVAQLRTEVLNHALRGLPEDRVRMHMCWGSYHGPHKYDLPLKEFVDIVLSVHAGAYSLEASNVAHAHEWRVWEEVKLPDGKSLIPGVVGHFSDFVEHPELVAERLVTFAGVVGRENVIAGTDCGLGTRVGHGDVAWAKLESLVEGAQIASKRLWG
jgi:5-methyltetrahydropteroyltriglutamate--homocysteine methyltransferase